MPFDFSKNKTVETLDGVPDDFKPFYQEASDGSGFTLADTPQVNSAVKVIQGLWTTVSSQRRELTTKVENGVKDALAPLNEYGSTAEDILAGIQTTIEEAKKKGKSDKDLDAALAKLRTDLTDVHNAEKKKWGGEKDSLISQIRKLLVDNVINEALGDRAISPPVAKRVIRDFVDIEPDENSDFRTIVKDSDNSPRKNVTDGQLFTVGDLVKELMGMDEYKSLFKSEAASGSGQQPGSAQKPVRHSAPSGDMSSLDKIAAGLKQGKAR